MKSPNYRNGGYDTHYAEIGNRFPNIDLAILENGQYDKEWSLIHLMPQYMAQTARDLKAKKVLTVHHSKYALAKHRWDEPLKNAEEMKNKRLPQCIDSGDRRGRDIRKNSSSPNTVKRFFSIYQ